MPTRLVRSEMAAGSQATKPSKLGLAQRYQVRPNQIYAVWDATVCARRSPSCRPGGRTSSINRSGTSKNRRYSFDATKLPANDSASFPFRFIDVHAAAARDR
jgi:hypothetical protein